MAISAETRQGFELLRGIFAGIAARHDVVRSRLVVAEVDYNRFLAGPEDNEWKQNRAIAFHGLTLRDPQFSPISAEDAAKLAVERLDLTIVQTKDGEENFIAQKSVNSSMPFIGDIPAFAQFKVAASDAGFFAIRFLHEVEVELKLPELVPISAVHNVRSVYSSTNLPGSLLERWVLFLHILGWQAFRHLPLRAERVLWHEQFRVSGDPERVFAQLASFSIEPTLKDKIPFPPKYFSSTLVQDVNLASVYAIDSLLAGWFAAPSIEVDSFRKRLEAIDPGTAQATEYHNLVAEILTLVCEPDLRNPATEDKIHDGRGRIDIVFDNVAEQGYFYDMQFRHNIKCPVVFFECKNYSGHIAGTEFAQLASRFSAKRSQVGFIVCRQVDNEAAVVKRCKDQLNDKAEHIVVLTDNDLMALLTAKAKNDAPEISKLLHAKWRPIFMDN